MVLLLQQPERTKTDDVGGDDDVDDRYRQM